MPEFPASWIFIIILPSLATDLNQDSIGNGDSGIVIGRYPGDGYAGGNPWQLLTAVLAETFYLGAQATLDKIEARGVTDFYLNWAQNKEWIDLLESNNGILLDMCKII